MIRRLPDGRLHHQHQTGDGKTYWHAHYMANGDKSTYRHPLSDDRAHPVPARPYPIRERPGSPESVIATPRELDPDPREIEHEPVPRQLVDRPRFPLFTWILVIAAIAAVAFLIANRPAPRSSHQPTVELSPGRGTTAGAGDTSPSDLGASADGSFAAPDHGDVLVGLADTGAP